MPIHSSWSSLISGLNKEYCKGKNDGAPAPFKCKKARSVFYAYLKKNGWDETKARPESKEKKNKMTNMEMSLGATIEFSSELEGESDHNVHGKSMNIGYIEKKQTILPKNQLKNIVSTLKNGIDGNGAYILKDHGYKGGLFSPKSVDMVVGRISNSKDDGKNVFYEGRIEDEDMLRKIKSKLLTATSIGLHIGKMNCSICGRDYGDPECNHIMGKEYPNDPIHDLAKDYIDEMGGKNIASVVCSDIRALEQSIVLFPAIDGSNIEDNMIDFSENTKLFMNEIESKKELNSNIIDAKTETFNNVHSDSIIDKQMSTQEFDIEKILGELTDLKASAKLNETSKATLENDKRTLELSITEKDNKIATLESNIATLTTERNTLKELNDNYKIEDDKRKESEKKTLIEKVSEMRKDKGLSEKDCSNTSLDLLKIEFDILSEFKGTNTIQGSPGEDHDPEDESRKLLEAKEDIREMIFRKRKDGKNIKNIVQEKDLKFRVN